MDESHSNSPKFVVATDGSVEVLVLLFSTQCHSEEKVMHIAFVSFILFSFILQRKIIHIV